MQYVQRCMCKAAVAGEAYRSVTRSEAACLAGCYHGQNLRAGVRHLPQVE